jgi:hypothetical protein
VDVWPSEIIAHRSRGMPGRRAWRRSLLISVTIHSAIIFLVLGSIATFSTEGPSAIEVEPLVRGALAKVPTEATPLPEPVGQWDTETTEVEPDASVVARAAEVLHGPRAASHGPDTYEELTRKSAILERISNSTEVSRMAAEITRAFGVRPWGVPTSAPAGNRPFDFDRGLLTDVVRSESDGVITYCETFTEPDGTTARIITRRCGAPNGPWTYEQTLIEPGRPEISLRIDEEMYADVVARARPFEIINSHPLVKQLHREAVLPILEKLIREEPQHGMPHLASPAH